MHQKANKVQTLPWHCSNPGTCKPGRLGHIPHCLSRNEGDVCTLVYSPNGQYVSGQCDTRVSTRVPPPVHILLNPQVSTRVPTPSTYPTEPALNIVRTWSQSVGGGRTRGVLAAVVASSVWSSRQSLEQNVITEYWLLVLCPWYPFVRKYADHVRRIPTISFRPMGKQSPVPVGVIMLCPHPGGAKHTLLLSTLGRELFSRKQNFQLSWWRFTQACGVLLSTLAVAV